MKKVTFILAVLFFFTPFFVNAQKEFIKNQDSIISKKYYPKNRAEKINVKKRSLVKIKNTPVQQTLKDEDILYLLLLSYIKEYSASNQKIRLKN